MSLSRLYYTRVAIVVFVIGYSSSMSCCISISVNVVSRFAQAQAYIEPTHAIAYLLNQRSLAPS